MGQSDKSTRGGQTTKALGDAAENQALDYLVAQGLTLVGRNYRTPGRGGGEIDLIMQQSDGTVVFVEVRKRSRAQHGGAAASVARTKQQRLVRAAQYYLLRWPRLPATRFDVVAIDGEQLQWIQGAFDAG